MKRASLFIIIWVFFAGLADAAVRGTDAGSRPVSQKSGTQQISNSVSQRGGEKSNNIRTATTNRNIVKRNTEPISLSGRGRGDTTRLTRVGASVSQRSAISPTRTTKTRAEKKLPVQKGRIARAATDSSTTTDIFSEGYTECHDAYFTCMDQFCATVSDTYRRCICSSKLDAVKDRERILGQTASQLQDFKDLNVDAILKTPEEVHAMLTETEGEAVASKADDKSESAQQLKSINKVLSGTRNKAMSTQGSLDAGGDIQSIWSTTDLALGSEIANLTGEALYNAVHAQCAELVLSQCTKKATLNMVISAYGMYIENDCSLLLTNLNKQASNANSNIRQTERDMMSARLENYNAHNATSINDCIAMVRKDITADTACGENYVHCLDITGKFLTYDTGTPIYSPDFYKLGQQTSLQGDVLNNKTNQNLVMALNNKKRIAKHSLETCRDVSENVWEEFMRQAITEIYQGQQARIRQVKDECMDVVNKCYDEQTQQLRDYSKIEDQFLLGSRLELSEEMCKTKLDSCSNLYGGGANGLSLLLTEMHNITSKKISQKCLPTLEEYAQKLCKVPSKDTTHTYPYGCRMYVPGDGSSAINDECLNLAATSLQTPDIQVNIIGVEDHSVTIYQYMMCPENRNYISCNPGYILYGESPHRRCMRCPGTRYNAEEERWIPDTACPGGTSQNYGQCSLDFSNSLYQKMVSYAREYCVRPSEETNPVPLDILGDVNTVMDKIRVDMSNALTAECEIQDGQWTTTEEYDETKINKAFYRNSGANKAWGWCKRKTNSSNTTSE